MTLNDEAHTGHLQSEGQRGHLQSSAADRAARLLGSNGHDSGTLVCQRRLTLRVTREFVKESW